MRTETVDLGLESDFNIAVLGDAIPQLCVEHLHLEPAGAGKEGREGEAGQRMHGLQSVNRGAASGVWGWQTKSFLVTDWARLFNCFLEGGYSDTVCHYEKALRLFYPGRPPVVLKQPSCFKLGS